MNIGRLRWIILAVCFAVALFGAYLKLSLGTFLPMYACTYVFPRGGTCFLFTLQRELGSCTATSLLTLLGAVVGLSILVLLAGRAWCGWGCPMGFLQDVLYSVRKRLGGGYIRFGEALLRKLAWIKWAFLSVAVALPLWLAFPAFCPGVALQFYLPFCQMCPGKFILPLCSANPNRVSVNFANPAALIMSVMGLTFSVVTLVGATIKNRFWCTFCPLGLILSWYRKLGFLKLKKDDLKCTKCDICFNVCPSEIQEVASSTGRKDVTFASCNLCLKCVENCPETGALKAEYLGKPLYVSSEKGFFAKQTGRPQAPRNPSDDTTPDQNPGRHDD